MIDGDPNYFLSIIDNTSLVVMFHGKKYFTDGICWDDVTDEHEIWVAILYDESENYVVEPPGLLNHFDEIFRVRCKTYEETLQAFLNAKIFDGLTFWEAEKEMTWVDD